MAPIKKTALGILILLSGLLIASEIYIRTGGTKTVIGTISNIRMSERARQASTRCYVTVTVNSDIAGSHDPTVSDNARKNQRHLIRLRGEVCNRYAVGESVMLKVFLRSKGRARVK